MPSGLEFFDGSGIHSVLVYVDHPRLQIGWIQQGFTEESLGGRGIAFSREQEIDGLPRGIHRPVEKAILPFDPNLRFIHPITFIRGFQMNPAALIQLRPVRSAPTARYNWDG